MIDGDSDPGVRMHGLTQAYRAAAYVLRSDSGEPIVMRIGRRCPEIADLLTVSGVATAAFLTAWNPGSRRDLDDTAQQARQQRLCDDLVRMGIGWLPGEGRDDSGDWREPSVLALGLDRVSAARLAERYGQFGFVQVGLDGVAELVLVSGREGQSASDIDHKRPDRISP
ncbi:MAG TPA: hypothetical protein DDZ76_02830 [Xanthomonadales bacterium]|nr:hypothetical protein [Xanthomonadales bacterium]